MKMTKIYKNILKNINGYVYLEKYHTYKNHL